MFNTRSVKGEETSRRIFETAMRLFRERGFEEATMRDVASAAGMSLGAAYHYFPGKEAIVMAYYDEVQGEHGRRVRHALRGRWSLRARLGIAFHAKLDLVADDGPLLGALLRFTGVPDHPLSFLGPGTRELRERSMAVFADAVEVESLPEDLRTLAPLALWALHMGLLLFLLYDRTPDRARTRRLTDGALDLFVMALKLVGLPPLRPFRKKLAALLGDAGLVPSTEALRRWRDEAKA